MAAKLLQLEACECGSEAPSIDQILCDPELRDSFDETARDLAPWASTYEQRLAVLAYRKSGRASTRRLAATTIPDWELTAPLFSLDPEDVPKSPGVYAFIAGAKTLFVSSTLSLRNRFHDHLAVISGQSIVPADLYEPPRRQINVSFFKAPAEWRPRRVHAVAWQMKHKAKGLFNLLGNAV